MKAAIVLALAVALLSGCAKKRTTRRVPPPPRAPASAPPAPPPGNTRPVEAARTKPAPTPDRKPSPFTPDPLYVETGVASWYGHPYHGRIAANGEIYDMEKLTAAHRTLPFDTWVRVVNLSNEKDVEVRITDRGPFIDGRIIDLSHAAAQAIDLIGPGTAQVRVEIISAPRRRARRRLMRSRSAPFGTQDNAERMRARMAREVRAGAADRTGGVRRSGGCWWARRRPRSGADELSAENPRRFR